MSYENDWKRLLLIELCPGKQLNSLSWALDPGGEYIADEEIDFFEYASDALARAAYPSDGAIDVDLQVSADADDCRVYWDSSNWQFNTAWGDSMVGYWEATSLKHGNAYRFQNITIPKGAVIIDAYITFTAYSDEAATIVKSRIVGNLAANPAAVADLADYQARRGTVVGGANDNNRTVAIVTWDSIAAQTADVEYNSPDISAVIQELVNQAGWASGNAMVLFWDDHEARGTQAFHTIRRGYSYPGSSTKTLKLHITYTTPQAASESTIKTEGSYSLKVFAQATSSLNKKLTRTIASPFLDLSGVDTLKFDIYSSRTGSNIKIGLHDSGGTTTEITPNVTGAGAWQTVTWDISAVADADKNSIDSIIITIVNADSDNTFYLDNFFMEQYVNYTYFTDLDIGEISGLEVDGVSLERKYTASDIYMTAGRFYHDFFAGRLYVHLFDGGDPGAFISPSYIYEVIASVWKLYSNRQRENGETISFIPDGCIYPVWVEPSLKSSTLSDLSAAISDHFASAMQVTSGGISIVNDRGRWWAEAKAWYWSNRPARAKTGEVDDAYVNLTTEFIGKVKSPVISDEQAEFELFDNREGEFQSIPPEHFDLTTYPNLKDGVDGKPIPVLFGEKTNISPAYIDTVNFTFKISQTHFGSDVFEIESIDAVYLKGVGLSAVTDYIADLHNGEFSLTFDPGDAEITCDAKGIKDEFDFSSSPFGSATGDYSENVADHLFFVLTVLNGIDIDLIDIASFEELQLQRTQAVAWYLDTDTATLDFNRLLQQTSLYHFLPLADGTFAARYYRKTVPSGTMELRDYDHAGFKQLQQDDGVFRDIFFKYAKDPTTGDFKTLNYTNTKVQYRRKTKEPFTIETALRDDTEAATVLAFYVSLLTEPPIKIEDSISLAGKSLIPTDKIYNNRTVNADGLDVVISQDEVYVILETRKNMEAGRVDFVAQLDTQLAIYTTHADIPHADVPHEDHSDTIHTDDAHGDDHTDLHLDQPPYDVHQDIAHQDQHGDEEYVDEGAHIHVDFHFDSPYEDAYADAPHFDSYTDIPHVDTGHVDHSDLVHTDAHTDITHIDSEV